MWNKIRNIIVNGARNLVAFLCQIHYRRIAKNILTRVGDMLHWVLFSVLFKKRFSKVSKHDLYRVIFKADTPAGKKFDIWLLVAIGVNIFILVLDSIITDGNEQVDPAWLGVLLKVIEWGFTLAFTLEYYLRIYCLKKPMRYVTSFYGIIDLLSIVPPYLSIFFPAMSSFAVLRLLRLLRIFRILDLKNFVEEGRHLMNALQKSVTKILIFMLFVFVASIILGSLMWSIERHVPDTRFTNIFEGIYWAVVTITTVGYGDTVPTTNLGQALAIVVMILGYSIIAVPTGIVAGETAAELKKQSDKKEAQSRPELPGEPEPTTTPTQETDDEEQDDLY